MARITRTIASSLKKGLLKLVRSACDRPLPVTRPSLAAISCNTSVASTENSSVHIRAKPYCAPALLAVITVPGPIKAAITINPGPTRFMGH